MADAKVRIIVKDPVVTEWKEIPPLELFTIEDEEFFLDGPVSARVAVLDFDPEKGDLSPAIRYAHPSGDEGAGSYEVRDPNNLDMHEVMRVSVFGTILKTIKMFEESDTLGRRISWAFGSNQLLAVPRAGEWANAFYERESHSLQFFYRKENVDAPVFTCRSQDIVAHETAHAVLDGIAPDLYDSYSPQALALHEGMADLTTLLMAFRSDELCRRVLSQTGGHIHNSSAFTAIAPAFARVLEDGGHFLRDLNNDKTLIEDAPAEDQVDPMEPHSLSQVLSGALYRTMVKLHDSLRETYGRSADAENDLIEGAEVEQFAKFKARSRTGPSPDADLRALEIGSERFKRVILRGLDYLPPGDVSFADYGRAVIASDKASHPRSPILRQWISREFQRRGITKPGELETQVNFSHAAVEDLDLEALITSDWVAYRFAEKNRELLRIPEAVPFEVRPRLRVNKTYYYREGTKEIEECILKLAWTELEENGIGSGLPSKRRIRRGTMLAIDWKTKEIRALLTTSPQPAEDRERFLMKLLDSGALQIGTSATNSTGLRPQGVVAADVVEGALRVRSVARTLHVAPGD